MNELRRWAIAVPAIALVVFVVASFLTRGAMADLPFLQGKNGAESSVASGLVDQRPWQTALALAPLAVSAEEKRYSLEVQRLADHEVDQAFAQALRQAAMETRVLTKETQALQDKVTYLQGIVKEDQAKVDSLTTAVKAEGQSANTDDLDFAKAQLQLDSDELADSQDDLARETGDQRGQIQQELMAREAAMKKIDEQMDAGGQTAVIASKKYGTLFGRAAAWFDERTRMTMLAAAAAQADTDTATLTQQLSATEKALVDAGQTAGANADRPNDPSWAKGRVARLAKLHLLTQIHGIVVDRILSQKQLSAVYGRWLAQVQLQHKIVTHLILQSMVWIATIALCGALLAWLVRSLLGRWTRDQRSLQTMRTIASLGIQIATLISVLLVIFGFPNQTPTLLGLLTAGLTVVFQDFILAFFGWFVLMGKNGIRVGDWVEINGVGGEVVEIGLFRTALLETGNWTDRGHPTGRQVTFVNKYAISGQYFNFSTTGQWMWDEISVNIPAGVDSTKMIGAIHDAVVKETAKDSEMAEKEWKRATGQYGMSQFSAAPSVDMRPASSGIDIIVRYVTRAGARFDMRNRLYQSVIDLLHKPEAGALPVGDGKASV